jgi:phosphatidylglycerophosphatase A
MRLSRLIASGFGAGLFPRAPGTAGSLAALLLGVGLMRLSPFALPLAVLLACVAGVWAIGREVRGSDPGWIVIDEFAGQWIAMLALSVPAWPGLLAAFLLFRLFDIAKPGPVGWADRRKDAVGVMADDVVAGLIAGLILLAVRFCWPGWIG